MCETPRFQASHRSLRNVWKYNKIAGKRPVSLHCLRLQEDCRQRGKIEVIEATTCENTTRFQATTRLQAMGGTFRLLTPPNILFETTTRLQATGANLSNWSHQWVGNVWKYNKIAGNRGKCKLLKPPVIWPCAKIQQDSRQATNNCAMCENTTKLQATGENWSYWSHHVWKYNKIPGKRPVSLHCLRLQEDCRQRGKIEVIEATTCENTTRFQATTRLQAMGGNI